LAQILGVPDVAGKMECYECDIEANTSIGQCRYRAIGKVLVFDGFTRLWPTGSAQQELPSLEKDQQLSAVDLKAEQHFTKPPARYNEASLVKSLRRKVLAGQARMHLLSARFRKENM